MRPGVAFTHRGLLAVVLLCVSLHAGAAEVEVTVTHYADAVVAYVADLDLLRADHERLTATLQLQPAGKEMTIDLSAAWQTPALVLERPAKARFRTLSVTVRTGDKALFQKTFPLGEPVRPDPAFKLTEELLAVEPPAGEEAAAEKAAETIVPLTAAEANAARAREALDEFAELETEEEAAAGLPRVFVPDLSHVPAVTLPDADRVVRLRDIVHPVYCDTNYPMIGSGHVAATRQTADPDNPHTKSFYVSLKQQVYDPETRDLVRWEKFLAELPLDPAWLQGDADITVGVPNDRLRLHRTDEQYRRGNRTEHMLGESMSGLAQLVHSLAVDDAGNIYFSGVPCGIVRFNVHTAQFEQPPVDFNHAIKEFLPTVADIDETVRNGRDIRATWGGYYTIAFSRDRVFYAPVMNTRSGNVFRCNGVLSLPVTHWGHPAAFRRALRLNAACWPSHPFALWDKHTRPGTTSRKLGGMTPTDRGVILNSYGLQGGGGPWRIDVADDGSTLAFGELATFKESPVPPSTRPPRDAGGYVDSAYGVVEVSRANLHLLMTGRPAPEVKGTVTIVYDVVRKERTDPQFADLARSLGGPSLVPTWIALPMPGQADRVLAAAEYGYYLSTFDLRPDADGVIHKSYLPRNVGKAGVKLPATFTLGPYGYTWFEDGDTTVLFVGGYTGLTRMVYARNGRMLDAFTVERLRMQRKSLDGKPTGGIKRYCYLIPGVDDRIFLTGHHTAARGGTAFSGGLISFNAKRPDILERLAYLSRGYHCGMLRSLVTYAPDGAAVQRLNIAGGGFVSEYADRLGGVEPPVSRGPKIFYYRCRQGGAPTDLYGLELPLLDGRGAFSDYEYSRDRRYMVVLQGRRFLSLHLGTMTIVDAKTIASAAGDVIIPSFFRPSKWLLRAPDDRVLFYAVAGTRGTFHEVRVSPQGRLTFRPYLTLAGETREELEPTINSPRAFIRDLAKNDGSYDLVIGRHFRTEGTDMRVVRDFIPPRR